MSALRAQLAGTAAFVQRDLRVLASYRIGFVTRILSVFFSLTLFYYISRLVQVEPFGDADAYFAFAVVGLTALQVLNSTLDSPPGSVRQELVAGTWERVVVSPLGPVGSALAMLVFPFAYALATAVLMLAFAALAFGLELQWDTAGLIVPIGALSALAFAPFGIALLAVVLVAKQPVLGTTWIIAALSLVAGLYFPVELLPNWIEWTSHVQPFTPAVDLSRNVLVGTPLTEPAWREVLKLVGFAALLLPPSLWGLGAAVRAGRRRGTIIEY